MVELCSSVVEKKKENGILIIFYLSEKFPDLSILSSFNIDFRKYYLSIMTVVKLGKS